MHHGKIQRVDAREWRNMVLPDVYFGQGYTGAAALSEPDVEEVLLLRRADQTGSIYLPLIVRRIPDTELFDATSAYGYGGPWIEGEPSTRNFKSDYDSWAKSNRIVSTLLRFHPILSNAELFSDQMPLEHIGPTTVWNTEPDRDLVASMSKDHRKSWRRATRAGIQVEVIDKPQNIEPFRKIYEQSMNRVNAKDFYHFPEAYWHALLGAKDIHLVQFDAHLNSRRQASVLAFAHAPFLHIHLSGTTDEGRTHGAAHVCRVAAAQWAQSNGLTLLHSGGGIGGEDSTLLRWKQKFDPDSPLLDYSIARLIHDQSAFESISKEHPPTEYFPPWRAVGD